jgi:hypothetical protein
VNATLLQLRQKKLQLAVANQGVSPDDGEVDGALAIHDGEQTAYEVVSLKVRQLAQIDPGA